MTQTQYLDKINVSQPDLLHRTGGGGEWRGSGAREEGKSQEKGNKERLIWVEEMGREEKKTKERGRTKQKGGDEEIRRRSEERRG